MKGKICFPHETHILVKFITIFCKSFFSPQRLHLVKEKKKKIYKYEEFYRFEEEGWEKPGRSRDLLAIFSQTLSVL